MDEIKSDPIVTLWANKYGFTMPELAQIQPGYFGFDHFVMNFIWVKGYWILACAGYIGYVFYLLSEFTLEPFFSVLVSIATTAAVSIIFEIIAFACMYALVRKNNAPLHLSTWVGIISVVVMGGLLIWLTDLAKEV